MCGYVGCWHPDFLFQVLSAEQWQGWIRFNELEPLGEWRHDARAAAICQRIGRAFGGDTPSPSEIIGPIFPYTNREEERTDEERLAELRRRKAELAAKDQSAGT